MEKEDFLETCLVLCGLDKESIIKTILSEKFKIVSETQPSNKKKCLPKGCDLLVHTPSPENFAEYAYELCALKENKDVITRHLLSLQFDASVEAASRPRVRTRQSKTSRTSWKKKRLSIDISSGSESDSEESLKGAARLLCNISAIKLPSKLHLFVVEEGGNKKILNTMSDILPNFFPGSNTVWPGIYKKDNVFVLLVMDNGRYKNNWKSSGTQNKVTWFTSHEDVDRSVMDQVVDDKSTVHVVRKRNGEMRYMGKRVKMEDTNREEGSCVMYVA